VPFCPVAGRGVVVAGRDAVPVRLEAGAAPPLARAGAAPCAAGRPLAEPVRAPLAEPVRAPLAEPVRAPLAADLAPDAALAFDAGRAEACRDEPDPDDAGRAELGAVRAGPPVVAATALSAAASSVVQFLNMKYCWPSVHRLVVTQ
jgi:hypothetical protein